MELEIGDRVIFTDTNGDSVGGIVSSKTKSGGTVINWSNGRKIVYTNEVSKYIKNGGYKREFGFFKMDIQQIRDDKLKSIL